MKIGKGSFGSTSLFVLCAGILFQAGLVALTPPLAGAATPDSDSGLDATVRAMGAPRPFNAVFDELQSVPRIKDEFETTAAYEERRSVALGTSSPQYLIWAPIDMEYVRYNADTQSLIVATYALSNTSASSEELSAIFGYGSELKKNGVDVEYSSLIGAGNVVWALPRKKNNVGTYPGQNAFGATLEVTKQEGLSRGVFERAGAYEESIWSATRPAYDKDAPPVAFEIKIEPAGAKLLKEQGLRAAFLVAPAPPYFASGTTTFAPTVRAPFDRVTSVKYIIGDIQGAALFDAEGELLATRTTQ